MGISIGDYVTVVCLCVRTIVCCGGLILKVRPMLNIFVAGFNDGSSEALGKRSVKAFFEKVERKCCHLLVVEAACATACAGVDCVRAILLWPLMVKMSWARTSTH